MEVELKKEIYINMEFWNMQRKMRMKERRLLLEIGDKGYVSDIERRRGKDMPNDICIVETEI